MIENAWNRKRLTSARCHPSIANGSERKDSQISMMERRPNPLTKFGGKKLYGWLIHDQSPKSFWASLPHVIDLKLRLKDMNLGVKGLNENEGNRSHSRDWWFYNSCRQQVVGCLPNFNTHWNDGRCLLVSNFRLPRSVEPSTNPESSWKTPIQQESKLPQRLWTKYELWFWPCDAMITKRFIPWFQMPKIFERFRDIACNFNHSHGSNRRQAFSICSWMLTKQG